MVIGLSKNGFKVLLTAVLCFGLIHANGQINFNYPLTGSISNYPALVLGGSATLTSGISPTPNIPSDPVGAGWLHLTSDIKFDGGYVYINQAFTPTLGVVIEFEFKTWSDFDDPADGISIFLYDGSITSTFIPGPRGGSLDYAYSPGAGPAATGGYLGIGLDEFGNYSSYQVNGTGPGRISNAIAIRGAATGTVYISDAATPTNYLAGTGPMLSSRAGNEGTTVDPALDDNTTIAYPGTTTTRPTDGIYYRKVRFYLVPISPTVNTVDMATTVQLQTESTNGKLLNVITNKAMGQPIPLTATFKIGLGASTGGNNANHEVRNLFIATPMRLAVSNTVDLSSARVGSQVNYTTVVSNVGINAISGGNTATLSIETNGVSITSDIIGQVLRNTLAAGTVITFDATQSTSNEQVYDITNFPVGGSLTLTYSGSISTSATFSISATNTATITPPIGFLNISTQDVSIASTAIIRDIDLEVTNIVNPTTAQTLGSTLSYTTVILNQGPNTLTGPYSATFSLDLTGLTNLSAITSQLSAPTSFVKNIALSQQQNKEVYDITELPAGQAMTLTYTATITSTNASAVNIAAIHPPVVDEYDDPNLNNNVSAVQTFIKPILTQPTSVTICTGSAVNEELFSDDSALTSYTWSSAPSTNTISVRAASRGHVIQDIITNLGSTSGTVIYTVTPTIAASLVLANGTVSTTTIITSGDSKTFTVFVRPFSVATITVLVSGNGNINYKESAVFTPSSNITSPLFTWYESSDGKTLITEGVSNNGVLTVSGLLPGTYTYYVVASNPDSCEGALFPATVVVNAIALQPPNVISPNGDGIEDTWVIKNIEQYSQCGVHIFDRWGNTVYSSMGYSDPWTGIFHDKLLPVGTYYYVVDLNDGSTRHYSGFVVIIR